MLFNESDQTVRGMRSLFCEHGWRLLPVTSCPTSSKDMGSRRSEVEDGKQKGRGGRWEAEEKRW